MKRERRWKLVAVLAAGMAVGVVMVGTPAGAHVSGWTHNWNTHIKPKADARYVNENQLLWAVVNSDASLARGSGVTSVATSGTGNYIVRFTRNVRQCAYTATIGLAGASGTETPGFITVVGAAADEKGVFVTTDDVTGASATRGFHVIVDCDTRATAARVVGARAGSDSLDNRG